MFAWSARAIKGKIGELFTKLKGTAITAQTMKQIANPNGNVRVYSGGETIVDAMEADIPNAVVHRVPAVIVQAFGVINVRYVDRAFTFRDNFWAYTSDGQAEVEYLFFFLQSKLDELRAKAAESLIPRIRPKDVDEIEISIPTNAGEIVARLRELYAAIDEEFGIPAHIRAVNAEYEKTRDDLFAQLEPKEDCNE